MIIVHTVDDMQALTSQWRCQGKRIGLVPTMGFLHEGHLSLVRCAVERADVVVVSIFVNPTQFGPQEDFDSYPRDFERDESLCREFGAAAVFYPDATSMYAPDHSTWVAEDVLSRPLCGRSRPTHFRGVTTVVAKLFNAVLPDLAVFGQKDAQQALVIQRMVRDLNYPIEIVVAPVVREPDGLAMSSRNERLTPDERVRARAIPAGLRAAETRYQAGERRAEVLIGLVRTEVESAGGLVDYVELVSPSDLRPLARADGPALLAVAAFFGQTRLIDNCPLA